MIERKGLLLRLDPAVHDVLAKWAADELRSTNAQIESLLRRALAEEGRLPSRAGEMHRSGRPPRQPAGLVTRRSRQCMRTDAPRSSAGTTPSSHDEMGALSTTYHDAMITLLGRFDSSARIAASLQISGIAFLLGMILLAIGLFRGRTAPGWVCIGLIAGTNGAATPVS